MNISPAPITTTNNLFNDFKYCLRGIEILGMCFLPTLQL